MELNIYNSLILTGIIQGFIFSIAVLSSRKNRSRSIYFLISLILTLSVSNLQYYLLDTALISLSDFYLYLFLPWGTLLPALIYCFVITTVDPSTKIKRIEKLLFLPFLIFLLLSMVYRMGRVLNLDNESFYNFFNFILNMIEILGVLFMLLVLSMLFIRLFPFRENQKKFKSEIIQSPFNWLKLTLVLIGMLSLYWAYLTYQNIFNRETFTSFYYLWIGMSALIYWLGYIGIYKYGIHEERKKIRKHVHKIRKTGKDQNETNEHIVGLEHLLTHEKVYLDPNLSLESVAERLRLSTSHLSRILNAELGIGFTDYLNSFRVQQAKEYLKNPEFSRYTILAIGLEAGFNSKSAFFKVFKKNTGLTPLEYKKENLRIRAV